MRKNDCRLYRFCAVRNLISFQIPLGVSERSVLRCNGPDFYQETPRPDRTFYTNVGASESIARHKICRSRDFEAPQIDRVGREWVSYA